MNSNETTTHKCYKSNEYSHRHFRCCHFEPVSISASSEQLGWPQRSNGTYKLPARALFSFKSSSEFVIMGLHQEKLCSQFSKMKELKNVHSWIHVKNKPPTRQNIMKEDRVTEDCSDRKLHVQTQRLLWTFSFVPFLPFVVV